ncbi:MAG: septal ring lytic transglycosylase RlpA family protein [Alphaproteobacteria bacterium]|nr:septal ring lytic transglycosylase RlpA family protein [Alphaproteobacteria bacterium]
MNNTFVKFVRRPAAFILLGVLATVLAGCANSTGPSIATKFSPSEFGVAASPRVVNSGRIKKGGGYYTTGKPYRVAGKWYTPIQDPRGYTATGRASWYGPNFQGRLTANGEIFDRGALTGAHPTLPLPSYVRVTNLENGRAVTIRINDRGPFISGRLIDLSERAAGILGYRTAGTARVKIKYIGPAPLEGDDTRRLVASIDTGSAQHAFGYGAAGLADSPDGAAGAASALALGLVPPGGLEISMGLGVFENSGAANDIARRFAVLAAVELRPVTINGRNALELRVDRLKPGVTRTDLLDLAAQLGMNDIILY